MTASAIKWPGSELLNLTPHVIPVYVHRFTFYPTQATLVLVSNHHAGAYLAVQALPCVPSRQGNPPLQETLVHLVLPVVQLGPLTLSHRGNHPVPSVRLVQGTPLALEFREGRVFHYHPV